MSGRLSGRQRLRDLGIWPFRWMTEPCMWMLARWYKQEPVPLPILLFVRRLGFGPDPLAREPRAVMASELHDRELSRLLDGRELGLWTLGADSIEELRRMVSKVRPRLVIEFGSGVSTICLAYFASKMPREEASSQRIISIEQDEEHARATITALEAAGLAGIASVVHAPITMSPLDGREYSMYQLPDSVRSPSSDTAADLVLVDGPAAENGARYATLHVVRAWLRSGTVVLLDDALRDGELDTASRWETRGLVNVRGVRMIDKGILVGHIGTG